MSARIEPSRIDYSVAWAVAMLAASAGFLLLLFVILPIFGPRGEATAFDCYRYWSRRDYSGRVGEFALLASCFFVWRARSSLGVEGSDPSYNGTLLAVFGFLLFFVSARVSQPYLALLSLPILIVGLAWSICGVRMAKALMFPSLLLLFLVPFPGYSVPLGWMSDLVAQWAFRIVSFLGVEASLDQTLIRAADETLWGFETAGRDGSQMTSLYRSVFVAVIMARLMLRRCWQLITLLILAPLVMWLVASLRIAAIILIAERISPMAGATWYHGSSALIFLLLWLIVVVVFALLLRRLGGDPKSNPQSESPQ